MGVRGRTSGTSADVPICRTYTPVGLKPMNVEFRIKSQKMKKKLRKRKQEENSIFQGRKRENVCFSNKLGCHFLHESVINDLKGIIVPKALDGQRFPLPLCECMWV